MPEKVLQAWDRTADGAVQLRFDQLASVVQHVTGYYPHARQALNAALLLDIGGAHRVISLPLLIEAAAQLVAAGLSMTLSPRHVVCAQSVLLKLALCCCHWQLAPYDLWRRNCSSPEADAAAFAVLAGSVFFPAEPASTAKTAAVLAHSAIAAGGKVRGSGTKVWDAVGCLRCHAAQSPFLTPTLPPSTLKIQLQRFTPCVEALMARMRAATASDLASALSSTVRDANPSPALRLVSVSGVQKSFTEGSDPESTHGVHEFRRWLASVDTRTCSCFVVLEQCVFALLAVG